MIARNQHVCARQPLCVTFTTCEWILHLKWTTTTSEKMCDGKLEVKESCRTNLSQQQESVQHWFYQTTLCTFSFSFLYFSSAQAELCHHFIWFLLETILLIVAAMFLPLNTLFQISYRPPCSLTEMGIYKCKLCFRFQTEACVQPPQQLSPVAVLGLLGHPR